MQRNEGKVTIEVTNKERGGGDACIPLGLDECMISGCVYGQWMHVQSVDSCVLSVDACTVSGRVHGQGARMASTGACTVNGCVYCQWASFQYSLYK